MTLKPNILLADETVTIDSPIEAVFAFVSDHQNYSRWYPGAMAVIAVDDLPAGAVGKIYRETLRLPSGREQVFDITVVESQAPDRFMTEGSLAPLHPRMEMRLAARSARETALNLKFFSRSQSALGRLLIPTLARRVVQRQSRAGLRKLKSILC